MKLSLLFSIVGASSVAAFTPTAFLPTRSNMRVSSSSSLSMALKDGESKFKNLVFQFFFVCFPFDKKFESNKNISVLAEEPIVIGVAADSGCGKSTFMRRLTNTFGGEQGESSTSIFSHLIILNRSHTFGVTSMFD